MIGTIITYNNAKLELLGFIKKTYGITERIIRQEEENTKVYPGEYCGNGEFNHVSEFDFKFGQSYWKKNGSPRFEPSNNVSMVGAVRMITISYPLTLVASIPRKSTSADDAYASERIANSIAKSLNDNNSSLKSMISARKVEVNMTGWNDVVDEIFRQEFSGIELRYDYSYVLMAIDFDIVVEINQNCLSYDCSYYGATLCEILNKLVTAQNRRDCILPEFDFSTDADFEALSAQQIIDLTERLCP